MLDIITAGYRDLWSCNHTGKLWSQTKKLGHMDLHRPAERHYPMGSLSGICLSFSQSLFYLNSFVLHLQVWFVKKWQSVLACNSGKSQRKCQMTVLMRDWSSLRNDSNASSFGPCGRRDSKDELFRQDSAAAFNLVGPCESSWFNTLCLTLLSPWRSGAHRHGEFCPHFCTTVTEIRIVQLHSRCFHYRQA